MKMPRPPETITIPSAVDIHVHLREPSTNKAETIESGSRAALLGGFALICDMPNNPGRPTWTHRRILDKHRRIYETAYIPIATYAGSQPEKNNERELIKMAPGSIGLKSYLGETTGNNIEYTARDFFDVWHYWHEITDKPIMVHRGSADLEEIIAFTAGELGHRTHICHTNHPDEVKIVSQAKKDGMPVTIGVCPHHIFKTSHDVLTQGNFAQMQPALAHQPDTEKLLYLLATGQIDAVESDHAPHTKAKKWEAERANGPCYGVPGIEFMMPLLFHAVKKGRISLERVVDATSTEPSRVIGLRLSPYTRVTWGMEEFRIENEADQVISGSGWTPYLGMLAIGEVQCSTIMGKTLIKDGEIIDKHPRVIAGQNDLM